MLDVTESSLRDALERADRAIEEAQQLKRELALLKRNRVAVFQADPEISDCPPILSIWTWRDLQDAANLASNERGIDTG